MTGTRMRGTLIVTLVTVLCSFIQGRSISKELLELNNHINTQFGFDYSSDEDFFSLIGVEARSVDSEDESDSYEYYDFGSPDKSGKKSENEYDEDERFAGADSASEEDGKKYIIPDDGGEQKEGRDNISEHKVSGECDENRFDGNHVSEESDHVDDNLIVVKSGKEKLKSKESYNLKNNVDDSYVNYYGDVHETSDEDKAHYNVHEEEEDEDYDQDYDYQGDASEELDESQFKSEEVENTDEEYMEYEEEEDDYDEDYAYHGDESERNYESQYNSGEEQENSEEYVGYDDETDYEEDYAYSKNEDKVAKFNIRKGENVAMREKEANDKISAKNEDENIRKNTSYEKYIDRDKFRIENGKLYARKYATKKEEFNYENYDDFNK